MIEKLTYADIALATWKQHAACHSLDNYPGILSMHATGRLAKILKSDELIEELKRYLSPFIDGKLLKAGGVYGEHVYRFGGHAAAFLVLRGYLPEAKELMIRQADALCTKQSRDADGAFDMPAGNWLNGSRGFLWIDSVFGVCPFLLWTGLFAERQDFIDESCRQMILHHEALFDESCGLYYQAVNFNTPGAVTPAHWSRGNGWAAIALAELAFDLPKDHKDYDRIIDIYRALMTGCRNHQDKDGLLHQAMEDRNTYVETSGTALVLYGMARGIKNGSLDADEFREPFLRGLKSMLHYIGVDGSVSNCCRGCLGPGTGTVADYAAVPWVLNDPHSFGPVNLLFGQAEQLSRVGKIPALKDL
jgi:unsaturated rhamnogalacturonyl hydrolase